jgi:excisionase family DNA binding protein
MKYLSVAEMAKKWNVSERTVRNYCAQGRIPNAFLTGKTWNIPRMLSALNVPTKNG